MKVQVITYTRTRNYGGILQAYALYSYLESRGHDVSFIDYVPERCNVEDRDVFSECMTRQSPFWGRNVVTKYVWRKLMYPSLLEAYKPFRKFLDTRCSFTRRYTSCDELMTNPPKGDVFVTGSDQVWNSEFTSGGRVDTPFYLPFVEGRKISYASSFGAASLDRANVEEVAGLLSSYDAISVRENSGVEILKSLGLKGVAVCDPTMLCDSAIWEGIASSSLGSDYVLLYQVRFCQTTFEIARGIARAKGKRLVVASMNPRDRRKVRGSKLVYPTVEQWLGLIKGAEAVVTDSFHACVFSTLFNRPFLVNSGARKQMSSRITDFLEMASIDDREIVGEGIDAALEQLDSKIDWGKAAERIEEKRSESRAWLSNALGE